MEKKAKEELALALTDAMNKVHEEHQKKPNQFIVAYKKKNDDSLIGYHQSTFCQVTDDILGAKRYAGDPDEQMDIIWRNFSRMMKMTEKDANKPDLAAIFDSLYYNSKVTHFNGLNPDDVYIDVIFLADETPAQKFTAVVINPENEK